MSARQTYNIIIKALEEFEIFQVFDSQEAFSQIQNPKANCIYFVYKPSESSDGLNMNFDLYSYDPDNNSFIKLDNLTFSPDNFAPKSHATSSTTYGIGTESNYGHTKVVNNLNQVSYADGVALSAYQGYVLNQNKQNSLVSGTNIKTINNQSLLGAGNIQVASNVDMSDCYTKTEIDTMIGNIQDYIYS